MTTPTAVKIDASPADGQTVEHDGKTFTTVREGRAYILVPPNARAFVDQHAKSPADDRSHAQSVFYNPIQQFNRDLSVLAIKAFGEDLCWRKKRRHDLQRAKSKQKLDRRQQGQQHRSFPSSVPGEATAKRKSENLGEGVVESELKRFKTGDQSQSHDTLKDTEGDQHGNAPTKGVQRAMSGDEEVQTASTERRAQSHNASGSATEDAAGKGSSNDHSPWRPRFRVLDALSATGLRALRYASEIPSITKVVANDREKNAVKSIDINVEHNKLSSLIDTTAGDAIAHMYRAAYPSEDSHGPHHQSAKYDVIDLDPYGTAVPFLDSALQALEDGGMLCVTCTDSAIWASCGYSEKTYALYGGMPIKSLHSHEGGLRLILHSIASAAARYGLAIEPLLSLSIDFYARTFVRVRKSPFDVKFLAGKTMIVYGCDSGCGAWTTQFIGRHQLHKNSNVNWKHTIAQAPSADRLCEHCGSKTHVAGPMWGGPLHNPAFIEQMTDSLRLVDEEIYQTKPRIEGMLDTALDELSVNSDFSSVGSDLKQTGLNKNDSIAATSTTTTDDSDNNDHAGGELVPKLPPHYIDRHPFYFSPSALSKVIKTQAPSDAQLKGAFRHAGYRVARTHCKGGCIKTDAPWTAIWEIMREWTRQKAPVKDGALKKGQAGYRIMSAMKDDGAEKQDVSEISGANVSENGTLEILSGDDDQIANKAPPPNPRKIQVVFDESLGHDKPGKRLLRYQQNPRENWGPMSKARGSG